MLKIFDINRLSFLYSVGTLFCRAGGKVGAMQKCRTCNGRGVKITMRQLGPGMVQQMQSVCPDCHGEGRLF